MDFGLYIISGLMIVTGLVNLLGVMLPFQDAGMQKYTDDSVRAWCRPNGIVGLFIGIGMAMFDTFVFAGINNMILLIGGIALIIIGFILTFVFIKKYLVLR